MTRTVERLTFVMMTDRTKTLDSALAPSLFPSRWRGMLRGILQRRMYQIEDLLHSSPEDGAAAGPISDGKYFFENEGRRGPGR